MFFEEPMIFNARLYNKRCPIQTAYKTNFARFHQVNNFTHDQQNMPDHLQPMPDFFFTSNLNKDSFFKSMNYKRNLNSFSANDTIHKQIRNIITLQNEHKHRPYSSKAPDGGMMTGPEHIITTPQEVSNSPGPTYATYLAGFFHLNK